MKKHIINKECFHLINDYFLTKDNSDNELGV